jgi:hypothetical protein
MFRLFTTRQSFGVEMFVSEAEAQNDLTVTDSEPPNGGGA